MFSVISGSDLTKLNVKEAYIVAHSADGSQILVHSSSELKDMPVLRIVSEESVHDILLEQFWKQPCISC